MERVTFIYFRYYYRLLWHKLAVIYCAHTLSLAKQASTHYFEVGTCDNNSGWRLTFNFRARVLTIFCRCCIYLKVMPFTRNRDAKIFSRMHSFVITSLVFYAWRSGYMQVARIRRQEAAASRKSSASHVKNHIARKVPRQSTCFSSSGASV